MDIVRAKLAGERDGDRRGRIWALGAIAWVVVTLASAIQGYAFAAYRGRQQDWWPTLGYTAAIFFVWALLTPAILKIASLVAARSRRRVLAFGMAAAGLPITVVGHLLIFITMFWPVYGSGASTPLAMAKPVFFANLDKAVLAYAAIMAVVWLRGADEGEIEPAERRSSPVEAGLWVRVAGGLQFIRFEEIDWIAAAGDYAEVHAGARRVLTDRSLADLVEQLPKADFARVHRSTILRLDRIQTVQRLGRGDASIILSSGQTLRLSRRYRENLAAHLPL